MRPFLDRFMPFVFLGIAIALGFFSLVLFGYLLLFGLIIGAILYGVQWIRFRFFSNATSTSHFPQKQKPGRTFDVDE